MTELSDLPAYLLDTLHTIAATEGFLQHTIERDQRNANNHDGFIGSILTVRMVGERQHTQLTELALICKLLPNNAVQRRQYSSELMFEREVYFYDTIVPALVQLQNEKGLDVSTGFFQLPKCYAAICSPERNEFLLVLENLNVSGYQVWPKEEPLHIDCVRQVMKAMGRLHGLSFAVRDQRPQLFDRFRQLDDIRTRSLEQQVKLDTYMACYGLTIDTLPSVADVKVMKWIRATLQTIWVECVRDAEPFTVIGHGDMWLNNMMFNDADVCILDWQTAGMYSPAADISFFLLSAMDKTLRSEHVEQLLAIYYDALSTIVRRCGSDPSQLFSRNDLDDQLRRFGKFGLSLAPVIVQLMTANEDDMIDVDTYAANVEEHGVENVPFFVTFNEHTKQEFVDRMSAVIADSIAYGWIAIPSGDD